MMRILLVVPYATGTIGRCSYNLFRALSLVPDVEVRVFLLYRTPEDIFDFGKAYYISNVSNSLLGRIRKIFRSVLLLRKIKKEWRLDLSIGTLNVCSAYNLLSGGSEKKIGIFHGEFSWRTMTRKSIVAYLWGRFCYRYLFSRLDCRVAVSQRVHRLTEEYVKSRHGHSCVIYNAHDVDAIISQSYESLPLDCEEIFKKRVLLAVGGLTANKGVLRLIRAFSEALKKGVVANLVFLGKDWGEKKKAISLAESLGIDSAVYFIDQTPNPYPYIKKAKVLVSASHSEGLPGVLCEAMVLNTPVIATNSSTGVWEILEAFDSYDEHLQGVFFAKKGLIVQNNSSLGGESTSYSLTQDELSLSEAITLYFTDEEAYLSAKNAKSNFVERIRFDTVSAQFSELNYEK